MRLEKIGAVTVPVTAELKSSMDTFTLPAGTWRVYGLVWNMEARSGKEVALGGKLIFKVDYSGVIQTAPITLDGGTHGVHGLSYGDGVRVCAIPA